VNKLGTVWYTDQEDMGEDDDAGSGASGGKQNKIRRKRLTLKVGGGRRK